MNLPIALFDHAVKEFFHAYQSKKDGEDNAEHYGSLLLDLCGDALLIGVFQIIDDCKMIRHISSQGGRELWEISGNSSQLIYLFPNVNYCSSCLIDDLSIDLSMDEDDSGSTRSSNVTAPVGPVNWTSGEAKEKEDCSDFSKTSNAYLEYSGSSSFVCKHVLAGRAANIMDRVHVNTVGATQLAELIRSWSDLL